MMKANLSLLAAAVSLLAAPVVSAAELATAKIFSITGPSTIYRADRTDEPADKGDVLQEGDGLVAGPTATIVLAFSNGSKLTLEPRASITLAEMSQDPFSGGAEYEQLSADPSTSSNLIQLEYGNVTAEVKNLKPGSKFDVETGFGTAAIRGTVLKIVFYPPTDSSLGWASFELVNGDASVNTTLDGGVTQDASGSVGIFSANGDSVILPLVVGEVLRIQPGDKRRVGPPDLVINPLGDEIVVSSPEGPSSTSSFEEEE